MRPKFNLTPYFGRGDDPTKVVQAIHKAARVLGWTMGDDEFGIMVHPVSKEMMMLYNDKNCGNAIMFLGDVDELYHLADVASQVPIE